MRNCKEYLEKQPDGTYALVLRSDLCKESDILIPEGAEAFGYTGIVHTFYKDDFRSYFNENTEGQWDERSETWIGRKEPVILWQRATHPEELPFIDDEPKYTDDEVKYMDENGQGRLQSLNDRYAEIEKVRQHNHYFKDVSSLNEIDVYMVLKLFNVTDPCLQHIAKKALCAGQRGHKDFKKDLQDILDTAKRAVEINK